LLSDDDDDMFPYRQCLPCDEDDMMSSGSAAYVADRTSLLHHRPLSTIAVCRLTDLWNSDPHCTSLAAVRCQSKLACFRCISTGFTYL